MKRKLIIAAIVAFAVGLVGYFGFQWYLSTHKAESEVVKLETKEPAIKDKTESGVTINSINELSGTYTSESTEKVSSEILFKIGGATATQGTFKKFEVSFEISDSMKNLNVVIDPASIYTAESMRDEHLRGDEFFNVKKFSNITFNSSNIVKGDTSYLAKGSIEFMGLKSDLTVPFTYEGQSSEDDQVEIFQGKFDFDRIKYGMQEASGAENKVTVSFYTALRKK